MDTAVIKTKLGLKKYQTENLYKTINILKRKNLYWITQVSGWGLFTVVNLLIISSFESITFNRIVLWMTLGIIGLAASHFYRYYIKKNNWSVLPLRKIAPRVITGSFITGLIIYIPVFFTGYLLGVEKDAQHLTASIAVSIINLTSIMLVWSLIYFAIHYFENSKKAEIETLIFEAAVKDFELKTLKAQLNPHFMFNAMNSIRALIEEDPQRAKDAITKLSNIMRYTLRIERTETVPLSDELKTIRDYLDLEKIRFEERLQYNISSTPSADRVEIPPMMVQTLVENGIKHGISKLTGGGEVDITASTDESTLIIQIRNNGQFNETALKISQGFGISNTKQRLSLLYGEKASLSLSNENKNIVLATLKIPSGDTRL
ncbi:MAG: histidine kinase [Ignavibacterium sp.]|jgi:sensor histidine kinase YesM|nr:histidine kinase [Ignavibacterium sp.]